jgi:membrane protein implicated in regulation of membrane protease activity
LALLFFNLGVEAGQLVFVAAVLGLACVATHVRAVSSPLGAWSRLGSGYAIGSIASFWLIDRVTGFW